MRRLAPPAALAVIALLGAGCSSSASTGTGSGGSANAGPRHEALRFAECMRKNGVKGFPDPDPSGGLTIDGVVNGSSLDPNTPTWRKALGACKDLQPSGFMGDKHVTPKEHDLRLEFARCMRENGVTDFPDPADGEPLVDTRRIPSAARAGGMTVINAAMQRCRVAAQAAAGR